MNDGDDDHGDRHSDQTFEVIGRLAIASEAARDTFDHSASWNDFKALGVWRPFDDLKLETGADRLVFLDGEPANAMGPREQANGFTTKMARLYGRCPIGERLVSPVPHGHWKTLTFIAALRVDGIDAPWVIDGPMDGADAETR